MKSITLTKGKITFVDDSDYEWLIKYRWSAHEDNTRPGKYYAIAKIGGKQVLMHRMIMGTPKGLQCDHKDNDGLNNQRYNLRNCTGTQNQANKGKSKSNTSGYKGVQRYGNRWEARIKINKHQMQIGSFSNPVDAAKAYDAKARELFGEFAKTNFDIG